MIIHNNIIINLIIIYILFTNYKNKIFDSNFLRYFKKSHSYFNNILKEINIVSEKIYNNNFSEDYIGSEKICNNKLSNDIIKKFDNIKNENICNKKFDNEKMYDIKKFDLSNINIIIILIIICSLYIISKSIFVNNTILEINKKFSNYLQKKVNKNVEFNKICKIYNDKFIKKKLDLSSEIVINEEITSENNNSLDMVSDVVSEISLDMVSDIAKKGVESDKINEEITAEKGVESDKITSENINPSTIVSDVESDKITSENTIIDNIHIDNELKSEQINTILLDYHIDEQNDIKN